MVKRKPTIAELEAILSNTEPATIEILPDGSIKAVRLPEAWLDRLRDAVNQACTCSWRRAVAEGSCPACEVWHRMQEGEVRGG